MCSLQMTFFLGTEAEFQPSDWDTDFPLLAQGHFILYPKMVRVKFTHNLMLFLLRQVTDEYFTNIMQSVQSHRTI